MKQIIIHQNIGHRVVILQEPTLSKNLVSLYISIDFHSLSTLNKSIVINNNKKSLTTQITTHASRKKLLKNSDPELEFPSLSRVVEASKS
jgi:hypothetical protein